MPAREVYDGPSGPEYELPRGDVTEGVVRVGDTVRRPHRPGSDGVAAFLDHLEAVGFDRAPRYLGRDEQGRDVLDFVGGDVAGPTLAPRCATDAALTGVARLNRALHDASIGWLPDATVMFPRDVDGAPPTSLPPAEPLLVAHNDLTPQHVVFRRGVAAAAIDFDLAGRTTALTDLATTAMHWVPLCDPSDRDPVFDGLDVAARLRRLLDGYGLPPDRRPAMLDSASRRIGRDHDSRSGQDGAMTDHDDTDALQQQFVAARERLSVARATLDQYASTVGQPVDTVPEEPAYVVNPAYDTAREEYETANAEFVRLEAELKPHWAEQAEAPVE